MPEAADHAEDLAALQGEVEPFVDDLVAERVLEAADLDDRVAVFRTVAHSQPISVKKTAKKASSTMTRKMPWTTAVVVRWPTSSAFPSTCRPW